MDFRRTNSKLTQIPRSHLPVLRTSPPGSSPHRLASPPKSPACLASQPRCCPPSIFKLQAVRVARLFWSWYMPSFLVVLKGNQTRNDAFVSEGGGRGGSPKKKTYPHSCETRHMPTLSLKKNSLGITDPFPMCHGGHNIKASLLDRPNHRLRDLDRLLEEFQKEFQKGATLGSHKTVGAGHVSAGEASEPNLHGRTYQRLGELWTSMTFYDHVAGKDPVHSPRIRPGSVRSRLPHINGKIECDARKRIANKQLVLAGIDLLKGSQLCAWSAHPFAPTCA